MMTYYPNIENCHFLNVEYMYVTTVDFLIRNQ